MLKWWWCTGALLLSLTAAAPAGAEPDASTRAAARNIATAGALALEQGDVELATQKLTKAYELLKVPSIALWLARALVKRGQLVEAAEHYIQAGRLSPSQGSEQAVQVQAQKDAARELSELTPRIPRLIITVEGASPDEITLSVDGKPLSSALLGEEQPLNPGAHAIRGTRTAEVVEQPVTLKEGQAQTLVLRFQVRAATLPSGAAALGEPAAGPASDARPAEAPPASDTAHGSAGASRTLAYVAFVVGGAALATGGITGALTISKRKALDDNPACNDGTCSSSIRSDIDSFRTMRTVSTIGFVAGGVCAGAGLVLWLTSGSGQHDARDTARLGLRFAPNAVSMTGSF